MRFENNERARLVEKEVPYVSFPVLEQYPFLRHGFSTRLGGVSEGIYSSMNLSFVRGDVEERVRENYRRIGESMGMDYETMVLSDQVHKTILKVVSKEDCGKGVLRAKDFSEIDGLLTNEPGVTLVTTYADCVPLYFVDPVHRAIAMSHAGWKGTVGKIGPKTIERMKQEYGSNPEDIVVVVGPSICQDCYEVSEDVAKEFQAILPKELHDVIVPRQTEYFEKLEKDEKTGCCQKKEYDPTKYQLNLWKANQYLLEQAGVLSKNITVSGVCTCCNSELFFSHRASHGKRGNLCGFLSIKE